ncbi:MAG: electron transport complex subunit E [Blautia sp.]|nr:electron transport complex subunit E [Blautia sp.]
MNKCLERLYNGIVKENPTFVLMLGMCPTLAVTTSLSNAVGMGVSTLAVLVISNIVISLLRKVIPDEVRLPAYIVIVASFVTIVELIMKAYFVEINAALGVYIPLIVVNCIILGRAEAYASKNGPLESAFDGLGMGIGFTVGLALLGFFREILGAGTVMGRQVMPDFYEPMGVLVKAPGAFLVLGMLVMVMNAVGMSTKANEKVEGCDGCCATCAKNEEHNKDGNAGKEAKA